MISIYYISYFQYLNSSYLSGNKFQENKNVSLNSFVISINVLMLKIFRFSHKLTEIKSLVPKTILMA